MKHPQKGARSDLQSHACSDSSPSCAAGFTPQCGKEQTQTCRVLSMGRSELRKARSFDSAWTGRLLAVEFMNVQQQHDRFAVDGQITHHSSIATVNMTSGGADISGKMLWVSW